MRLNPENHAKTIIGLKMSPLIKIVVEIVLKINNCITIKP